jgi:hypothetical protein
MSFTAPSTGASVANDGYLAVFKIGAGSPTTYTAITEIKSFNADPMSVSEVACTHLLSPSNTEEFVPSMIKPGKITFSGNLIGDASQLSIMTLAQAQTIFPFQIIAPVQRKTKTYTGSGSGFIASYKIGPFENGKAIEISGEVQMTGPYTEVVT